MDRRQIMYGNMNRLTIKRNNLVPTSNWGSKYSHWYIKER